MPLANKILQLCDSLPTGILYIEPYTRAFIALLVCMILLVLLFYKNLQNYKQKVYKEIATHTASLNETVKSYKQINNNLEIEQQQLLDNDKTKEEIIAIILHDLWSPLTFMAQTSNRIANKRDTYSESELYSFLDLLGSSANDMVHLVDQLLKWLRDQHGAFQVNMVEVKVEKLLGEIVEVYEKMAIERGNKVVIQCPPGATITTDPTILTLIVRNMVDNAIKNTKNGNIILCLETKKDDLNSNVLKIMDNGKGINEENMRMLLQLAEQESLGSSSLGFRFAFQFAKLINAVIYIESNVGKGTAVSITLPFTSSVPSAMLLKTESLKAKNATAPS